MNYEFIKMDKNNAIEYAKINVNSWRESYVGILNQDF